MNAHSVIRKLRYISTDPIEIWDAFVKNYNKGFFNNPIEIEFGITPDTHDKLIQRFDRKMQEFKDETKNNLDEIFRKFEVEKSEFIKQIIEKDRETSDYKKECERQLLLQRVALKEQFDFKMEKELAVYYKLNIDEK